MKMYAQWAGNPNGIKENKDRCVEAIWTNMWDRGRQCNRKRGHGPDGLYCKQHAKKHEGHNKQSIDKQ